MTPRGFLFFRAETALSRGSIPRVRRSRGSSRKKLHYSVLLYGIILLATIVLPSHDCAPETSLKSASVNTGEVKRMTPQSSGKEIIVAVDPGRDKCGVAVVTSNLELLSKEIVPRDEAVHRVLDLAKKHQAHKVVLGDRTGSREFAGEITKARMRCSASVDRQRHPLPEIFFIDEHKSSMEGRRRYLLDHPLRGLGKLIPVSLRTPGEPFDDYVAVVLAERFFQCLKG